ncbi:hypothetical protein HID58_079446, partial [Brassica napus]
LLLPSDLVRLFRWVCDGSAFSTFHSSVPGCPCRSCALRFRYLPSVASSPSSVRWCSTLELMVGMIHGEAVILWCHVVPWFKTTGSSDSLVRDCGAFGSIAFGLSSLIVNRLPNQLLGWRSVFS